MSLFSRTMVRVGSAAAVLCTVGGLFFAATASANSAPAGTSCLVFARNPNNPDGLVGNVSCNTTVNWSLAVCIQYESAPGNWVTDECQSDNGTSNGSDSPLYFTASDFGSGQTWRMASSATVNGVNGQVTSDTW